MMKEKLRFCSVFNLLTSFTFILLLFTAFTIPADVLADNSIPVQKEVQAASPDTEKTPRIIGGTVSSDNAWPWIAALVTRGEDAYDGQFCGGTLIDSEWVVTAAHCLIDLTASEIDVVLGVNDLTTSGGERIEVDRLIRHPNYLGTSSNDDSDNDIALLHLKLSSSQQTTGILYSANESLTADGSSATIIGWGNTSTTDDVYPEDLMEAEITIFSAAYGQSVYGSDFTDNMIIAGKKEGGIDSCQGDSGGPMVVRNASDDGWLLAGITSFGDGCAQAGSPGVYAKVMNYTDWIEENTEISNPAAPSAATLTSPSGSVSDATPAYNWNAVEGVTWYKLFVWNSNKVNKIDTWYDASLICSDDACTVTPDTILAEGSYEGYLKSWNDYGSTWSSSVSFSVSSTGNTPSQVTLVSPSGTTQSGTTTFVWTEDANASWYKLYLQSLDKSYKFVQWYEIADNYANYPEITCTGGQCSITISASLESNSYEWYVLPWSEYGSGSWSSAGSFTVTQ
ncbi:MAG: serine protease [Desulfobacteraceae bacterium]|nr:serine protease [Desulfobacteraceae bacterium]